MIVYFHFKINYNYFQNYQLLKQQRNLIGTNCIISRKIQGEIGPKVILKIINKIIAFNIELFETYFGSCSNKLLILSKMKKILALTLLSGSFLFMSCVSKKKYVELENQYNATRSTLV